MAEGPVDLQEHESTRARQFAQVEILWSVHGHGRSSQDNASLLTVSATRMQYHAESIAKSHPK